MPDSHSAFFYETFAKENKLEIVANPPQNVREKVRWRCILCGRITIRSYHTIRYGTVCRCRTRKTITKWEMEALALALKIKWISVKAPLNSKEIHEWESWKGVRFKASFADLKYHKSKKLMAIIDEGV